MKTITMTDGSWSHVASRSRTTLDYDQSGTVVELAVERHSRTRNWEWELSNLESPTEWILTLNRVSVHRVNWDTIIDSGHIDVV